MLFESHYVVMGVVCECKQSLRTSVWEDSFTQGVHVLSTDGRSIFVH